MTSNLPMLIPVGEMQVMAAAIAKSNLFGLKTPEQALTMMLIAQAEGRHPALAARDYDIIQGRPAKKAEAMVRDFMEAGGKIEWHALSDDKAEATFSHPQGGTVRIDWDMARAKKAGLAGKDTWQKFARAMLRARCCSEGIRTVWPGATSGMYVPEEVRAMPPREEKDMGKAEVVTPAGVDTETGELLPNIDDVVDKMRAAETMDALKSVFGAAYRRASSEYKDALKTIYDECKTNLNTKGNEHAAAS